MKPPSLQTVAVGDPAQAARTIVLLHGFTQSGTSWQPIVPCLQAHGALLVPDLIGHGRSPAPVEVTPYAMEACVAQVLAVLDAAQVERAWWLGYSMGGRVALQVAAHHPERVGGLVLLSATPGLPGADERTERRLADEALAQRIEREGVAAFLDFWMGLPLFAGLQKLPPEERAALRAARLGNTPVGLANSLRGMGTGAMPPVWDALSAMDVPTLLLAGMADAKFTRIAKAMAAQMPQATLRLLEGVGHALHLEAQSAVCAELDAFFAARNG